MTAGSRTCSCERVPSRPVLAYRRLRVKQTQVYLNTSTLLACHKAETSGDSIRPVWEVISGFSGLSEKLRWKATAGAAWLPHRAYKMIHVFLQELKSYYSRWGLSSLQGKMNLKKASSLRRQGETLFSQEECNFLVMPTVVLSNDTEPFKIRVNIAVAGGRRSFSFCFCRDVLPQ